MPVFRSSLGGQDRKAPRQLSEADAAKKAQTRENVLLALPAARMVNYTFR